MGLVNVDDFPLRALGSSKAQRNLVKLLIMIGCTFKSTGTNLFLQCVLDKIDQKLSKALIVGLAKHR